MCIYTVIVFHAYFYSVLAFSVEFESSVLTTCCTLTPVPLVHFAGDTFEPVKLFLVFFLNGLRVERFCIGAAYLLASKIVAAQSYLSKQMKKTSKSWFACLNCLVTLYSMFPNIVCSRELAIANIKK